MRAPVGKQKRNREPLAMSDLTVEKHEAPPGWDHGTRASHRDGRLLPNGPLRRWGIRPRLMTGMLLTGLSLGWLGGFNSQWLLDAISHPETLTRLRSLVKLG